MCGWVGGNRWKLCTRNGHGCHAVRICRQPAVHAIASSGSWLNLRLIACAGFRLDYVRTKSGFLQVSMVVTFSNSSWKKCWLRECKNRLLWSVGMLDCTVQDVSLAIDTHCSDFIPFTYSLSILRAYRKSLDREEERRMKIFFSLIFPWVAKSRLNSSEETFFRLPGSLL